MKLPNPEETVTFCGKELNDKMRQYCQPEVKEIILELSEAVEISHIEQLDKACCMFACNLKTLISFCKTPCVDEDVGKFIFEK